MSNFDVEMSFCFYYCMSYEQFASLIFYLTSSTVDVTCIHWVSCCPKRLARHCHIEILVTFVQAFCKKYRYNSAF